MFLTTCMFALWEGGHGESRTVLLSVGASRLRWQRVACLIRFLSSDCAPCHGDLSTNKEMRRSRDHWDGFREQQVALTRACTTLGESLQEPQRRRHGDCDYSNSTGTHVQFRSTYDRVFGARLSVWHTETGHTSERGKQDKMAQAFGWTKLRIMSWCVRGSAGQVVGSVGLLRWNQLWDNFKQEWDMGTWKCCRATSITWGPFVSLSLLFKCHEGSRSSPAQSPSDALGWCRPDKGRILKPWAKCQPFFLLKWFISDTPHSAGSRPAKTYFSAVWCASFLLMCIYQETMQGLRSTQKTQTMRKRDKFWQVSTLVY